MRQSMSESARLEQRYRRLLACYPRAFRRENEEEILAVLPACAQNGQQRPGLAASVDLIKGAIRAWLWPATWPPRTVRTAIRLIYADAAAHLALLITIVATAGSFRSAVALCMPKMTSGQANALRAVGWVPGVVALVDHVAVVARERQLRAHDWLCSRNLPT
jgi:hypothetical protein